MVTLVPQESIYQRVPRQPNTLPYPQDLVLRPPKFGQGKSVMRVMTGEGCQMTFVPDKSYKERSQTRPAPHYKGSRHMHRTTLKFSHGSQPDAASAGYQTTHGTMHGGRTDLPAPERPARCRSMHTSQVKLEHSKDRNWRTHYTGQFADKWQQDHVLTHWPTFLNKTNMNTGAGVKQVMRERDPHQPDFWTQYRSTHDKLGAMRAPGEPKEYVMRQSFNPITGDTQGDAWKFSNHRSSGNRVLLANRQDGQQEFKLG